MYREAGASFRRILLRSRNTATIEIKLQDATRLNFPLVVPKHDIPNVASKCDEDIPEKDECSFNWRRKRERGGRKVLPLLIAPSSSEDQIWRDYNSRCPCDFTFSFYV
jgi:hypothetical protein